MKNYSFIIFVFVILFSIIGCKKEYQRPQKYEIDLFANEKKDTVTGYIMSEDEAYGISDMVIASSDISVSDSSSGRGKPIYIYSVNSGDLLFSKRDSAISYPYHFLSNSKLDLKKEKNDSVYVFLEKLRGYKSIAEMKNIKYQWLKGAPVYILDNEKK
ncbi:hypothetical protein IX39_06465 [Chryseobacterium formosense]|uniref:Lipoprotein n=1 Tax=Chryseobacterium formosense TaxID=236814 RepID=A0A085Z784_9FLAO|nr:MULTISPECIES: hypothetical protein [Chryseobacterium]KFF00298.1 hypothetical protein IX39_06465 [Chryseobacterium formosense]OCK51754.1 hypothetical protein BA768_03325 [Chryseobacterium sp. CBo1]SFT64221.1 hypothetical protein SAMN05421857_2380 [Chryseobacterium formosense]